MTSPSVRFVMEQARADVAAAELFLSWCNGHVTTAVHGYKKFRYVNDRSENRKPHIYLAQYPSGNAYWRVCGSKNRSLNIEANLACNELNQKRHGHSFD